MTRRDDLGKQQLPEAYFRGGYSEGWRDAVQRMYELVARLRAHQERLEGWTEDDLSVTLPPPQMALNLKE